MPYEREAGRAMGTRASKEAEGVPEELTAKISDCPATRGDQIHPELGDTGREMGSHRNLGDQVPCYHLQSPTQI